MRLPSLDRSSGVLGSSPLLRGALLLLLGFIGGLAAQARDLPLSPAPAPRQGAPGAASAAVTAPLPAKTAVPETCRAAAELVPAGTAATLAGAVGLPAGTFSGFSGTLPMAAEPPPRAPAASAAAAAAETARGALATNPTDALLDTQVEPANSAASPAPAPLTAAAPPAPVTEPAPPLVFAASPPPAPPQPVPPLGFNSSLGVPKTRYGKLIYQTASRYALNPLLVAAMVGVESDFNPRARSRKGALGLMQMLPATARRFGLLRRRDLFDPRKNLEAAGRYLRWLVGRFGDDPARVLAAYNAGEGAVDRFGGVPPFAETRGYVQRIFAQLGFTALLDVPMAAVAVAGGTK